MAPSPSRSGGLWSVSFALVLGVEALLQFSAYVLNPIAASYAVRMGSSLAVGGFVAGLVAMAALAARPATGLLADRVPKTKLLVAASALFAVSAFGCAIAPNVAWVGVLRVVQGVAFALRSAAVVSIASMVVPGGFIGRAVGWIGVVTMISCALAPSVAHAVSLAYGYAACFLLAGLLFSVGLALSVSLARSLKLQPCAMPRLETVRASRGRRSLREVLYAPAVPYSAMAALSGAPHAVNVSLLLVIGDARGIADIAWYFSAYALAALAARPLAGYLCDAKGFRCVAAPALVLDLAGVACLALMDSGALAVVAGALVGAGQGSAYSVFQAESVRGVAPDKLGRASNTFYIGPDINMGITPLAVGAVMQVWGASVLYGGCFVVVLCSLVMLFAWRPTKVSR